MLRDCLPASWLSSYLRIAPLDAELLHSCPLYCENKQRKSDGPKLEKPCLKSNLKKQQYMDFFTSPKSEEQKKRPVASGHPQRGSSSAPLLQSIHVDCMASPCLGLNQHGELT